MSSVVVAAPRLATFDVAKIVSDQATLLNESVLLFDGLSTVEQKALVRTIYRMQGMSRPRFGLATTARLSLTTLFDPAKGKDTASNAKVGKNTLPTLSLTIQSAGTTKFEWAGRTVRLNTCPNAGLCAALCVLNHGRGKFPKVKAARDWRTFLLWNDPVGFVMVLRWEILQASARHGAFLARLNVNSDIPWHEVPALFAGVDMRAYDYTKDPTALDWDGWVLPNYRRIYSINERTDMGAVRRFLANDGTVAMVTNRRKGTPAAEFVDIADRWFPMVDGDVDDDRYHTARGVVVDLHAKGKARNRKTAFVRSIYC